MVEDKPSLLDMFVDLFTADPRGILLETATNGYEALVKEPVH